MYNGDLKATTVEQGETLLKLGISRDTADVLYYASICDKRGIVLKEPVFDMYIKKEGMPMTKIVGWTLETLFRQLPVINHFKNGKFYPVLTIFPSKSKDIVYMCAYQKEPAYGDETLYSEVRSEPLEAVYNVLVWALKNKEKLEMSTDEYEKLRKADRLK
jgi:hypothetical protein